MRYVGCWMYDVLRDMCVVRRVTCDVQRVPHHQSQPRVSFVDLRFILILPPPPPSPLNLPQHPIHARLPLHSYSPVPQLEPLPPLLSPPFNLRQICRCRLFVFILVSLACEQAEPQARGGSRRRYRCIGIVCSGSSARIVRIHKVCQRLCSIGLCHAPLTVSLSRLQLAFRFPIPSPSHPAFFSAAAARTYGPRACDCRFGLWGLEFGVWGLGFPNEARC